MNSYFTAMCLLAVARDFVALHETEMADTEINSSNIKQIRRYIAVNTNKVFENLFINVRR